MVTVKLAFVRDQIAQNTTPGSSERKTAIAVFSAAVLLSGNECFNPERFSNAVERVSQETAIQQLLCGKA